MSGYWRSLSFVVLAVLLLCACQPIQAPTPAGAELPADIPSAFVDNNGVRIHYRVVGDGPPLVLMHGWSGSVEDWRLFGYEEALKADHRLIMIDARGNGQSDKPLDSAAYALESQVSDIVAVLDELGVDKTDFYGFSLGGWLGWAMAKHAPDRLSSLVIHGSNAAAFDPVDNATTIRDLGADEWAKMIADYAATFGFSADDIYAAYATNDVEALVVDVETFAQEDLVDSFPQMKMPILLIAGAMDPDAPGMERATEVLPDARMEEIAGHDHFDSYLQTDKVVSLITEFLAQKE